MIMRTIRNTILAPLLGTTLLTIGLTAHAFELEHSAGTLRLENTPQKIVSYELAHLDTLNALGIEVSGVPQSVYGGGLAKVNHSQVVGTLFDHDADSLDALHLDYVIPRGRSDSTIHYAL